MLMEALTHQKRLLLVEDEPSNQALGVVRLKKIGWMADVASNGFEALDKLRQRSYDLVLMDCQMPEMDGFTAAAAIRSSEPGTLDPDIPIIAMTASSMKDYQLCLAAGMDDFISKLASMEELAAKLEYWRKKSNRQKRTGVETIPLATRPVPSLQPASTAASAGVFEQAGNVETDDIPIFNEGEFLKRLMHDHTLARMIMDAFLLEMPGQIESLKQYISHGDEANAHRVAHGIRGASSNLAAHSLASTIRVAEGLAKEGDLVGISLTIPDIENEFEQFAQMIRERHWMQTENVI